MILVAKVTALRIYQMGILILILMIAMNISRGQRVRTGKRKKKSKEKGKRRIKKEEYQILIDSWRVKIIIRRIVNYIYLRLKRVDHGSIVVIEYRGTSFRYQVYEFDPRHIYVTVMRVSGYIEYELDMIKIKVIKR